ncbi:MAG: uroporphyrinogen-III C-methyltransferase [Fibrobacter sp.]|nr:uroporphyrinogen-III C-methyltransferase [Fibrobacter sp.]
MSQDVGKVYLIGAGPGDPGLLTLRGKSILESADVVVYDRLVSPSILAFCNANAQMVDVGKMPTHHKVKQSEINKLLVQFAKEHPDGVIARLKGGDPFVFGRGGEEALELKAAGVEYEVVPGVTSAIAVPAYAGIPVSHRGIATSFHIVTGHERDNSQFTIQNSKLNDSGKGNSQFIIQNSKLNDSGKGNSEFTIHNSELNVDESCTEDVIAREQSDRSNLSSVAGLDFPALAKCPGTLIFLMGIANMDSIARHLMECGKDPQTPLAFIEKGTTPFQRTVMATLETAGETIVRENVTAPAITIMGDVVELGKSLAWKQNLPLSGKRLVVTRSAKQSSGITSRLTALGAEVIETPMIETRGLAEMVSADFANLKNFDVLAFTSANGVEHFFTALRHQNLDVRILAGKKIASVGKITEKKLLEYGILCDYVPEDHTGEGLGKLLAEKVSCAEIMPDRILLLQGNLADETLLKLLPAATRWIVYETLPAKGIPAWKREAIGTADAVVFASSSAVEAFVANTMASDENAAEDVAAGIPKLAFCIGRLTEATARKNGFETITSDETSMDSLVKKIAEFYSR